jgi:hypothetical protein
MNKFKVTEETKNKIVNGLHGEVFRSRVKPDGSYHVKLDKRQEKLCREAGLVSDENLIEE